MVEIQRLRAVPAQCESATVLFERIGEILKIIPKDLPKKDEFEERLKEQRGLIFHTPREEMFLRCEKVERILTEFIPTDSEFGMKAFAIYRLVHDD